VTDAGDPRGRQQDRGYYGAGWSQPAPPAAGQPGGPAWGGQQQPTQQQPAQQQDGQQQYGQQQYGLPYGEQASGQPQQPAPQQQPPSRASRRSSDPRRAFAPGASVANTTGALIAVVSIVLVEFVSGVLGLLGTSLVVHPFSTYGTGASLLGSFVSGVFASPFPFYAGAFLALAFLTPIARRSPLPTVLLRAVLAGAAGTVALALVGVFTGSYAAVRTGSGARLVIDVLTGPLQEGVPFTLMLLATATVAWLWLGRPRGGRAALRSGAGRPGTVRPADAVPPSTVQPVPGPSGLHQGGPTYGAQPQHGQPGQQAQPGPYGQQAQPGAHDRHAQPGRYGQQGPQQGPADQQQPSGDREHTQRPDDRWAPPTR